MPFSQAPCDASGRYRDPRSKDAVYVWIVANEAAGSMRACRMMLRSSRRLVCRGHQPGRHVNDLSSVH
ncbi:hypothetical protein TNCV_2071021 [Trichonephila clavipes]|uniref:Uncharacterized protein n=1 Tax=Trichonephila clavipes TaxID=2585209 RepID=A0A8X7BEG7_TRICX|nr:hypothetical protein TNCV_2071021 [Trichonephila clavipes]